MALFRRFFYRKPPDRLLEISDRVYVFDCCFSTDVLDEDEYRTYMNGIVAQLQDHYPDAAFMVFNFKERDMKSQLTDILSQYGMTVMDYPQLYEGCPLLPLEMIHHFLRSSESWLSVEGQQNVLLLHCERGGWPVLAFMLAGLLLYRKQYSGEQKTLEMVYKQAPKELLHLWTPFNPQPSQLRYLQYTCRRDFRLDWPQSDTPLALDCVILRNLPLCNGGRGCRPVVRLYGQDPSSKASHRSSKLLFSTTKVKKHIRLYREEECALLKLDIHCHVQGDVVLECIHLEDDLMMEAIMFRIMFHTEFVRSNVLMLTRDEVDVLWEAKDQIPREFRAEVLFSDPDSLPSIITAEAVSEDDSETEAASPEEFFEAEEIFSSVVDGQDGKGEPDTHTIQVCEVNDEIHHEINESQHEVTWKDDLEHQAFQDCALDEASRRHGHEVDRNSGLLLNGDIQLESGFADVASEAEIKSDNAGTHGKSEEEEHKERKEMPNLMKKAENKGRQQKLVVDNNNNNNNQKLDKGLSVVQKKHSLSSSKSDVGTGKKSKQQDPLGHLARPAKPTAVSRWIPSNKGSYINSMHVYYPPSRSKSAPAILALRKDSPSGEKSKPQFFAAASASRGRGMYASCPSSLDLSLALGASSPTLSDIQELSLDHTPTSHSPRPSSPPPPPPPPHPPPPLPPLSSIYLLTTPALPPATIPQDGELRLPPSPPPYPNPPPPPHPSFSCESNVTVLPSRSPPSPPSQNKFITELLPSNPPAPPSYPNLFSTYTSLRTMHGTLSPPEPPTLPTSSSLQNVARVLSPLPPPPPPPLYVGSSVPLLSEVSSSPDFLSPSSPEMHTPTVQSYATVEIVPPLQTPLCMHNNHSPPPSPSPPPPQTPPSRSVPAPLPPPLLVVPTPSPPPICDAQPVPPSSSYSAPPSPPDPSSRGALPSPPLASSFGVPLPPSPHLSGTMPLILPPSIGDLAPPSITNHGAPPPPPPPPFCEAPPPPPVAVVPLPPQPPPFSGALPPPPAPAAFSRVPPPPPMLRVPTPPFPPTSSGKGAPAPPPPPGGHIPGSPAPPGPPGNAPPPPPIGAKERAADGRGLPVGRRHDLSRAVPRKSNLRPLHWSKLSRALQGSLWEELQRHGEPQVAPEFDVSEIETLFSAAAPKSDKSGGKAGGPQKPVGSKPIKVQLIDLKRAYNVEIMLTKVKMPLPDMMAAVLAMDDSLLDADQVENLIKFCPKKEEMELLKGYTGDKENLGKCEQFFLELMKAPRVESKLRVFLFKIQFNTQVADFRKSLNIVNSACEEARNSLKLKEIMKKILYLGNTLNQGTARGAAIGYKLDSLLKLTDTRASNSRMTLMHYLCKVFASKSPDLLDFHKDLVHLEAASKIQFKPLAEEMQAIDKGLEKVKQELAASENDGPVSETFHKTLKGFVGDAQTEVSSVMNLYSVAGRNADALSFYFGEDPARCPFEQVTATLLNFVRLFQKAHEENCKQAALDKKKAQKEADMENAKATTSKKKEAKD